MRLITLFAVLIFAMPVRAMSIVTVNYDNYQIVGTIDGPIDIVFSLNYWQAASSVEPFGGAEVDYSFLSFDATGTPGARANLSAEFFVDSSCLPNCTPPFPVILGPDSILQATLELNEDSRRVYGGLMFEHSAGAIGGGVNSVSMTLPEGVTVSGNVITVVPELSTWAMMLTGFFGLLVFGKRRQLVTPFQKPVPVMPT